MQPYSEKCVAYRDCCRLPIYIFSETVSYVPGGLNLGKYNDILQKAGEALELSQILEEALTIPIVMMFVLESGKQKDLSGEEITKLYKEASTSTTGVISKPVNKKYRQDVQMKIGRIKLMAQNGTMGELKRALEGCLQVSPNGPSPFFDVLQDALDVRNHLCHEFFKKNMIESYNEDAQLSALEKLDDMQASLRKAISFVNTLTDTIQQQFPKTFSDLNHSIH